MAMVRFATTCDACLSRSEEYTAWPTCRVCLEHVCPRCMVPSSVESEDVLNYDGYGSDGERETVVCNRCHSDQVYDSVAEYGG